MVLIVKLHIGKSEKLVNIRTLDICFLKRRKEGSEKKTRKEEKRKEQEKRRVYVQSKTLNEKKQILLLNL